MLELDKLIANLKLPLSKISLIKINPIFNISNDKLNIYNIQFDFDENIIPLLTSLFEKIPIIKKVKTYTCIDSLVIITRDLYTYSNKYILESTSFQTDIDQNKLTCNTKININKYNTIKTHIESNFITRIYSFQNETNTSNEYSNISKLPYNFLEDVINESETCNIIWDWNELDIKFEIVILPIINPINKLRKCKYDLNIKIIEDNLIIKARSKHIEKILNIIHKIKSTFILD